MRPLLSFALCAAAVALAAPVEAQASRWILTAVNGEPVRALHRPFELMFVDEAYGAFTCGRSSGDFAIVGGRIVFRESLRVLNAEHADASLQDAHAAFRCDRALQLNAVASRGDQLILTGQTLGSEVSDIFTFSPASTTGSTQ